MVALKDHERVEYEPEVFPALVCRISDPKIVFLFFSSGKIIITGGKNMEDIKAGQIILKENSVLLRVTPEKSVSRTPAPASDPASGSLLIGSICRKKTDHNYQEHVIPMTDKPGHFEKGIWVEDSQPVVPQANSEAIEKRLSEAAKAVITSIDNVMSVTHDLVTTDEGKQFIEKTMKDTQKQIQQSFDAIISRAKAELDKTKAGLDKKVKR
jgi:ElaB/YqjD/DUF883 family membrane-anchored ribosome-binding protein